MKIELGIWRNNNKGGLVKVIKVTGDDGWPGNVYFKTKHSHWVYGLHNHIFLKNYTKSDEIDLL